MSDQSPLIIPITVEALVVNDAVRLGVDQHTSFLRAEMQYNSIQRYANGDPSISVVDQISSPGVVNNSTTSSSVTASDYYNGVYLKWRLPDALTRGTGDGAQNGANQTSYKSVPNRWLIVRFAGTDLTKRQATAWIVESDYQWPSPPPPAQTPAQNISQVGSLYVAPPVAETEAPTAIRIGRSVPLATSSWSELGNTPFLTAMGPGNPAFAVYQPACNNVFSFVDTLNDQPDQTLSYHVLGWHSSSTDDPLTGATAESFASLITSLNWQVAPGAAKDDLATWTLYSGYLTGVQWQTEPVYGGTPKASDVSVAIGNTAIEALTTVVEAQAKAEGKPVQAELFEAFQFDLLRVLDQPDGEAVLAEKVHNSTFQKFDSGYGWTIVQAPGDTQQPDATELANEETWLAQLNQAQANLDAARLTLSSLQDQLYVMWWKANSWPYAFQGSTEIPGLTQQALQEQLDPTVPDSLAQQVTAQIQQIGTLTGAVPYGDTPTALQEAITLYAQQQGLPASRVLKRITLPRFNVPNNPVVLFSGAKSAGIAAGQGEMTGRFATQIATVFTCTDSGGNRHPITMSSFNIVPSLSRVSGFLPWTPALINALVQEFFFLDPCNATMIAAQALGSSDPVTIDKIQDEMAIPVNYTPGTLPVAPIGPGTAWGEGATPPENPWRPLLLCWQGDYYPITYSTPSSEITPAPTNWRFDGQQYVWTGDLSSVGQPLRGLQGRILLTPQASLNMENRVRDFIANNPDMDPVDQKAWSELLEVVGDDAPWDFLSQALNGFNDQLLSRMTGVFLSPNAAPTLSALIGSAGNPPALGNVPVSDVFPSTSFQPWRSGQFIFTNLALVDQWGQALYLIDQFDFKQFNLFLPPEMTPSPTHTVIPATSESLIQLPPALLQPARLAFDLVSATNDADILGLAPDVNPICGWVLPNHLDHSLECYDAAGNALGELAVGLVMEPDGSTTRQVSWTASPDSPYPDPTLPGLATEILHFGPFLDTLAAQGPDTFTAFLRTIDETLWTTVPAGAVFDQSLSVLLGRPLALVRAQLQFLLAGPPYSDPAWQFSFDAAAPAVTGYQFAIELGNQTQLEDGLIGYFVGDQYDAFNVASEAGAASSGYLHPIGKNDNYLYMPFDGATTTFVSMLVDPRAAVRATTVILPIVQVTTPINVVNDALARMDFTFRVGPLLTDQLVPVGADGTSDAPVILMPLPAQKDGTWSWIENDEGAWTTYQTASSDVTAHLSSLLPVLRRGLLNFSGALDSTQQPPIVSPPDTQSSV